MGRCPLCGAALHSTHETATTLGVSSSRVRGILGKHPWRLQGRRVGEGWVVPAEGVAGFQRQRGGARGAESGSDGVQAAQDPTCPGCGERLFSTQRAATVLGVSPRRVQALLHDHPDWLQAFRVGDRWLIPERGLESYRARRKRLLEAAGSVGGQGEQAGTAVPVPAGESEVVVVVKPEVCNCGAYPFPHRKGGGRCKAAG